MTNQERQNNTKKIFIEAFWAVAKAKGNVNVKVEDVVKKSGYNRATFYRYFKGMDDIIEKAEEDLIEQTKEIFYKEIYEHNFDHIVESFLVFDEKVYFQYLLISTYKTYMDFATKLKKIVFDAGQDFEPFASLDELSQKMVVEVALGGLRNIYLYYLSHNKQINFEEAYNCARKYVLFGVNDYVHPKK